jgi:hypothetical protein
MVVGERQFMCCCCRCCEGFEELLACNPDLSQLNPDLSQLNPDLSQLNPNLSQLNPDLSQLNPTSCYSGHCQSSCGDRLRYSPFDRCCFCVSNKVCQPIYS